MTRAIRIDDEYADLIEEIADQLDTSIKEVADMIFKWFFSTKGGFDEADEEEELIEELDEEEAEELIEE